MSRQKDIEHVNCKLCGENDYRILRIIDGRRIVRCKSCGLLYKNPRSRSSKVEEMYSEEYFRGNRSIVSRNIITREEIEKSIDRNKDRAEKIIKEIGFRKRLLDIGCGPGLFIACLKEYGLEVTGVDISKWAAMFARDTLGLKVFTGTIEELDFEIPFEAITMLHLLEHLADPLSILKKVYNLISNNGLLIINGPNFASFDRLWHGSKWRHYDIESHLYFFTPKTYTELLKQSGFIVKKMYFDQWNPMSHLMEMRFSNYTRADHSPGKIKFILEQPNYRNNLVLRSVNKTLLFLAKAMNLKGRDITIYAQKKV